MQRFSSYRSRRTAAYAKGLRLQTTPGPASHTCRITDREKEKPRDSAIPHPVRSWARDREHFHSENSGGLPFELMGSEGSRSEATVPQATYDIGHRRRRADAKILRSVERLRLSFPPQVEASA
jgi:hypothetical protein